jgi:tetratricopeptide (TPR) repeat protein
VERYPNAPIVFQAGMKQGDLLRLMNDFASAQLLFENLINAYPGHPRRYMAELAYADCLVALARENSTELAEAAVLLERLLDLPGLPEAMRVEVGYKLGLVFQRSGAGEAALGTLARLTGEYLLDPQSVRDLGPLGRYWLSRAVIELGSMLEGNGEVLEAQRLYRKIIAFNLPGRSIVTERMGEVLSPETAAQ